MPLYVEIPAEPRTCEARQWQVVDDVARSDLSRIYADQIIEWINTSAGQAHFHDGLIVIRKPTGWLFAHPGDYVKMGGEKFFARDRHGWPGPYLVKPFEVVSPAQFEKQWRLHD